MSVVKKFKLKSAFNALFYIVIIILLLQRVPGLIDQYQMEGTKVSNVSLQLLSGEQIDLSRLPSEKILVFWATWCAPCSLELSRYSSAINEGELPKDKIFFVNMAESEKTINKYMKKNAYTFNVVLDPNYQHARNFKVESTPTVVLLSKSNEIKYIGSGFAPLGIQRAKWLFAQ